jgi:1,4-alpha-glucan branching enzyme
MEETLIRKRREKDGTVRLIFAVEDTRPVSLVCDRNGWDPHATPLVRRTNGTRSASIRVPAGTPVRFRYLADGGEFYDDPSAEIEDNGVGGTHSVITA